ncbi:MAG: hypothetical protein RIC56_03425 [Pseudomonadales bacterium]
MIQLRQYINALENRIIGRVFSYEGQMHFVVGVDDETGLACVNYKGRRGVEQILMPLAEVVLRLQRENPSEEYEDGDDEDSEDLDVDF